MSKGIYIGLAVIAVDWLYEWLIRLRVKEDRAAIYDAPDGATTNGLPDPITIDKGSIVFRTGFSVGKYIPVKVPADVRWQPGPSNPNQTGPDPSKTYYIEEMDV